MDEPFELPVTYRGEDLMLPAQLVQEGYIHKFKIRVKDTDIFFEPDEEGSYRALVNLENMDKDINVELLQAIASSIENILR